VWAPPAAISTTPEDSPETWTGTELFFVVPFPSWPERLRPQQRTPPPAATAQVWAPPAAISTTPEASPVTWTGTELFFVVPFPSWPERLSPQQLTPPDVVMAQVC